MLRNRLIPIVSLVVPVLVVQSCATVDRHQAFERDQITIELLYEKTSPDWVFLNLTYQNLGSEPKCVALADFTEPVGFAFLISSDQGLRAGFKQKTTGVLDKEFSMRTNAQNAFLVVPPKDKISYASRVSDQFQLEAGNTYSVEISIAVFDCQKWLSIAPDNSPVSAREVQWIANEVHGDTAAPLVPRELDAWYQGFSNYGKVLQSEQLSFQVMK